MKYDIKSFNLSRPVNFFLLDENAKYPEKGSEYSAGYDLHNLKEFTLEAGERELVDTGIGLIIPPSYVGLIRPRSKLAVKWGIDVLAGVVDSDYRGRIHVCLQNLGKEPFHFEKHSRIAQILIMPVCNLAGTVHMHGYTPEHEFAEKYDTKRSNEGILSDDLRIK